MKVAGAFATLAVAEAATLAVTWEDCGAQHAVVDNLQPTSIETGSTTTLTGSGKVDEDVTSAHFSAVIKAHGVKLTSCEGDATTDIDCKLPLGAGKITVKAVEYPIAQGDVDINVEVSTSSVIPAQLAQVDVEIRATEQSGEDVICMNVHTKKQYRKGFVRQPSNGVKKVAVISDEMRAAAPAKLDWSAQGATTAVKDQGQCGSCWAYSATEGIEAGLFMATGQLTKLSEQQIISCDKEDGGCDGGDLPTAFDYVQSNGGIDTQSNYPDDPKSYNRGQDGKCNKQADKVVKITDYEYAVPPCEGGACKNQKESDMMAALNSFGPLSVCVNADWDSYNKGIYTKKCSGKYNDLDHCVQLVGYDTTGSKSYWKVRNSWAADWGEDGFIRLPMGENACGIADEAMYVKAEMVSVSV
jgi:C1A family cysteine protease